MTAQTCRKPLVSAVGVSKHFVMSESLLSRRLTGLSARQVMAVDAVSMEIYPGETVGLVGESGCGKSTFGRVMVGLLQPTSGQVYYGNTPIWGQKSIDRSELKHRAQIIFQNPYSSLSPRYTVRQTIDVALAARGVPPRHRYEEARSLMTRVGLSPDYLERYPHQLSGGQRQRVAIARALATQPEFIVADEPLSSLDVSVQAQIISLLEDLQNEYGLSYLLIAHDLRVVYHMCNRVAVMYGGQIVEFAPTDALYERPLHPFTRQLLGAIPGTGGRRRRNRNGRGHSPAQASFATSIEAESMIDSSQAHIANACQFWPRCEQAAPVCKKSSPELLSLSFGSASAFGASHSDTASGASTEPQGDRLVRCHMAHNRQ